MIQTQSTDRFAHRLYVVTLVTKAMLGVIQLATAAAIFAGMVDRLPALAKWLFQAELAENPNDFLATKIISLAGLAPASDLGFYSVYFAAHGVLHVGVVIALLYGATWAHRVANAVLWAFVTYQMFEWVTVGGATMLVLSAIDLGIIYLTYRENRRALR